MSYRNSVGARLMLAFAGVIIVFGVAVGMGIARPAAFNTAVSEITGPEFTKVTTVDAWLVAIAETNRHTRNMLILDDKAKIQAGLANARACTEKKKVSAPHIAVM